MNEKPLTDAAAREAIRTRLDRNFLVEAGAGSGKTTCLVERMAALLAGGFCRPEKMAAVTFTRKAAGELKEKFQLRLEEMCREEGDPAVKERLGEALGKMERVFVGTIHSFCARLLRERPVEAGIAPDFTEIEGLEERLLEEMAWEEYLLEVRFGRPELLRQLAGLDLSPEAIRGAFQQLNRYPDVEMASRDAPYPELSRVRGELQEFCRLAERLLPSRQPHNGWDSLQRTARRALRWQRVFDLRQDRYLLRLLERMDRNASPTYNRWPDRRDAEALAEAFNHFRKNALKPARQAWLEYRHAHLLRFLLPAAERYRELRRRENKLNYQDLLMQAAELLKNNPEVRGYFRERFSHLLVDEFQDTDPIQAEVMFYLTGTDPSETDWTALAPRAGSLFVVGDPKQSIYRFRRADIDTYYRVKDLITASGGEVLHLTSNFRSLPELIDWSNRSFDELFAPASAPHQAEFVPMDPVRQRERGTDGGIYRLELEDVKGNNREQIAWQDAERTADWIARALDGELELSRTPSEKACGLAARPVPGDFLLLVHYKRHMALYARALEARGIPFTLSGGGDISESAELKELLVLLQALADPDNPVPLVAALRGLFFGISDDHLYRFKMAGGQFAFLRDLPPEAEGDVREAFEPAWEALHRFWGWSRDLPPSSAVQKIASDLGLLPLALAQELGRGRAGYLLQALELLREQERRGETGFSRAVEFLLRLQEEGLEEELDIEGGGTSAVRVMNLHKAKGLEAPVVILGNPGRSVSHEPNLHIIREADEARGYMVIERATPYGAQALALPPEWDRYREEEKGYQEAEAVRLLYVAATRARDLLLVSTYPRKPENSPWHPLERFLEDREALPAFEPPPAETDEEPEPITLSLLEAAEEEMEAARAKMSSPTCARLRPAEVGSEGGYPQRSTRGRGTAWGNLIHAALEALVKGLPAGDGGATGDCGEEELRALSGKLAREHGGDPPLADEVLRALREITSSPFWRRVCASPERLPEVPFGIQENGTCITGAVDLAFREGGGWALVDYKTDAVEGEDHLRALADYYAGQVDLYRRCWEKITGEKVAECGLFFTTVLRYVKY